MHGNRAATDLILTPEDSAELDGAISASPLEIHLAMLSGALGRNSASQRPKILSQRPAVEAAMRATATYARIWSKRRRRPPIHGRNSAAVSSLQNAAA